MTRDEKLAKIDELVKLPVGLLKDAASGYVRMLEEVARGVVLSMFEGHELTTTINRERYDALAEELALVCVAGLMVGGKPKGVKP